MAQSLAVVFDRMPKYAWVLKQLLDPDRMISFRVAWIDDSGISRVDRGFRCQYTSTLGPYEGGTAFGNRYDDRTLSIYTLNIEIIEP
jgi:glutamate dehydrogenase (NADP+)